MISRIAVRSITATPLTCSCRHFTRSSPLLEDASPSSKICAVPFRQTPQAAMQELHNKGLLASANLGNAFHAFLLKITGGGQWVHDLRTRFKYGKKLEMKTMRAVYYPIWRVDAALEGPLKPKAADQDSFARLTVEETYVPGNSFAPLSYLSFAVPPLPYDLDTYDPSLHLKQLGDGFEVAPIPFTASPLGLLEKLKTIAGRDQKDQGERYVDVNDPGYKEHLVGCYPIMFPIYIAEFELEFEEGDQRLITLIMDAHDDNVNHCRVSFSPLKELYENSERMRKNYFWNNVTFMPDSSPLKMDLIGDETIADAYTSYMSPRPISATSIAPSPMLAVEQEEKGVKWDDPRIQSWTVKLTEPVNEFIAKFQIICAQKAELEGSERFHAETQGRLPVPKRPTVTTISVGKEGVKKSTMDWDDFVSGKRTEIQQAEKELEELTPSWMKQWRETQGLEERIGKIPQKKPKKAKA